MYPSPKDAAGHVGGKSEGAPAAFAGRRKGTWHLAPGPFTPLSRLIRLCCLIMNKVRAYSSKGRQPAACQVMLSVEGVKLRQLY